MLQPSGLLKGQMFIFCITTSCLFCGYGNAGKSVKTDAAGKYKIDFEPDDSKSYAITAEFPQYFEGTKNEGVLKNKKNKDVNLELQPEAYLKLHIKNVNPFDESDSFLLGLNSDVYGNSINRLYGVSTIM
jgi:hypothetical protein